MSSALALLGAAIQIYSIILLARVVMSWIPATPGSAWEPLYNFVYRATEPPLAAIRSVIPSVRMGAAAVDLSPLILWVCLQVLFVLIAR
jgi:YggT family protein